MYTIPTTATVATYTADGWTTREITIDLGRVQDFAEERGIDIHDAESALYAAAEAYGYHTGSAGPWHGMRRLESISNGGRWLYR